jgi:glycosyltransferase involved in cell wall biosynthesis
MEKARGEYIGIVESDDWIEPDMYERLLDKAESSGADVVKCDFFNYWSDPIKNQRIYLYPKSILNKAVCPRDLGKKEIFSTQPCVWAGIYRRDFLQKHDIRFLETPGASYQDVAFNFKVFVGADKIYFLSKPFVHYRQDNASSSIKNPGKVCAVFEEYDSVRQFMKDHGYWSQPMITYFLHTQEVHWMWHLNRVSSSRKARAQFFDRLQTEFQRLAEEIPDFDEVFRSIHPAFFLFCARKYPRLTRFFHVYLHHVIRVTSNQKHIRIKLFGIRFLKFPYSL